MTNEKIRRNFSMIFIFLKCSWLFSGTPTKFRYIFCHNFAYTELREMVKVSYEMSGDDGTFRIIMNEI